MLNQFYKDGLRMVEVYKHQFIHLPQIINELQNRNYKFVIFMDDLSFEDLADSYHIDMDKEALHAEALTWQIRYGGFSGRTAKQFINMLLGR